MKDWVAIVKWEGNTEIVDVQAENYEKAVIELKRVLKEDYNPGWQEFSIEVARPELYIGSWS